MQSNRLNVALSRAREKLIIVTNLETYQTHPEFTEILNRIKALPNTRIEHVTANDLGITLSTYKRRAEIQILPDLSDLAEPVDQPPTEITPPSGYFDIY